MIRACPEGTMVGRVEHWLVLGIGIVCLGYALLENDASIRCHSLRGEGKILEVILYYASLQRSSRNVLHAKPLLS